MIGPVHVAGVLGCSGGTAPSGGPATVTAGEHAAVGELLGLLSGGVAIYRGRFLDHDRLDPGRGPVVPLTVRTDGVWVWSESSAYYLREHRVRPCRELTDHLLADRSGPDTAPDLDELDRIREHCDLAAAELAARDRGVPFGFYATWLGREWHSDRQIHPVPSALLRYQHPLALAYGFDLRHNTLHRTIAMTKLDAFYMVRTEVRSRGTWIEAFGVADDHYAVETGNGAIAAALDIPMLEPGVWRDSVPVAEVDSVRETRRFEYRRNVPTPGVDEPGSRR